MPAKRLPQPWLPEPDDGTTREARSEELASRVGTERMISFQPPKEESVALP